MSLFFLCLFLVGGVGREYWVTLNSAEGLLLALLGSVARAQTRVCQYVKHLNPCTLSLALFYSS